MTPDATPSVPEPAFSVPDPASSVPDPARPTDPRETDRPPVGLADAGRSHGSVSAATRDPAAPAASDAPALPGEHRGGFHREFTEPVPITATTHTEPEALTEYTPAAPLPRSAPWALVFAVLGLVVSFLVGWGFLIGLVGAGLAIVALRRPWESRGLAVWALCLSLLSVAYSAGWLWWASTQGPLFG